MRKTNRPRGAAVLLLIVGLALSGAAATALTAHAAEIVPALGITRPVHGDQAKLSGSLALRGNILPLVQAEIGAMYRTEERNDGQLKLRQWPITASLYLRPARPLYAGAGVGWYHTSYDYKDPTLKDETKEQFGVHLGGGLQVPLTPAVAADLSGRYVMMRHQTDRLVPEKFDPNFWTLQAGLAFRF